ncbi:hypothetical protein AKJ16_DCAP20766 [Drosera capensis]
MHSNPFLLRQSQAGALPLNQATLSQTTKSTALTTLDVAEELSFCVVLCLIVSYADDNERVPLRLITFLHLSEIQLREEREGREVDGLIFRNKTRIPRCS